ncbi:hypothetical protein SH2C18_28510 [Clostridium sediminicola]|uniref:efflux RND transporter permease subunit n=1 Tax=Clostridium sediminicola TaxID=3114879 RepID=UPI0031F22C8B
MTNNKKDVSFIEKLATFIIDKRNGFFLVYAIFLIFCIFSISWVKVNNDITSYLPPDSETRYGLTLMEEEVTTFGTAKVMISNITFDHAKELTTQLQDIEGISEIAFDNTDEHYKSASALFDVTFEGEEKDEITHTAMDKLIKLLDNYDIYISSSITEDTVASLAKEMKIVLIFAFIIIVAVLLFTSKTYMEIPVLLLTFGIAAALNMGTNFLYGEISFVSKSICVVLQLALAIDYAIILCHRFTEERKNFAAREAAIIALSKAIPEISSSSLTTISGLMALMFMQFRLGFDMGIVLIKALLFSIVTVFTLMPGLLMLFTKSMDKTKHRNFVPKINLWGKIVIKTRYIIPAIFIIVLFVAFFLSNKCNFVYGTSKLSTVRQNDVQIAKQKINETFGSTNLMAVLVPSGDYKKEAQLLADFEGFEITDTAVGLANIDAIDGYVLTDTLKPRQFAELTDIDIEKARFLYSSYAINQESYGKIASGVDNYSVPLIDIFMYLYHLKEDGYISLDEDLNKELDDMHIKLNDAKIQLQGKNYTRLLLLTDLPDEGEETFNWLQTIHQTTDKYYDEAFIVGSSTSNRDLATFFVRDNLIISILSALFVMAILLFTFKSAGLPVLLVLTIQGSIWINFSFPTVQGTSIFFMTSLVVTSIQMGATIDYAIVITSRYMDLKQFMPIKEAIIESLNQAFPTIITSGTILASAGMLIGRLSSDYIISSIGICLGRGTIISLILVMGVLPQILLFGNTLIEKTGFVLKRPGLFTSTSGDMRVNGRLKGYISGMIDAEIKGTVKGNIKGIVEVGSIDNKANKLLSESNSKEVIFDEKEQ